ncbi:MAG: CPBP family glutamic-type intramembrane protease [Pseudomonadota bacterium]|nr:CPBP family glutamic-type intramembrane protease [Pseudomonadota bacterium]
MDAQTTSRAVARSGPGVWLDWARFVARPQLPIKRVQFGWPAVCEVGWLLLLDVMVALPLAAALTSLARQTGLKTPEFEVLTKQGPAFTLLIGALVLPLLEETLFRGWLDGRRRHLVIVGVFAALAASLFAAERFLVGMALIAALAGVTMLWIGFGRWLARRVGRTVPAWFEYNFARFYFGSALLFGLAHMSNYPPGRPWLLLPFVLPQAFAGLLFGFARVRHGMWANVALHAGSNALFLGLSLSGF